jgi:hypothetical protein
MPRTFVVALLFVFTLIRPALAGQSAAGAFLEGFLKGLANNRQGAIPSTAALLLYGGENRATYLGCLNCSKYDADSLLNQYGEYGNKYSSKSIFNRYSDFGNRYSQYSPCNAYTQSAPAIVDREGNFYGHLTVNKAHANRIRDGNLLAWIAAVCAD